MKRGPKPSPQKEPLPKSPSAETWKQKLASTAGRPSPGLLATTGPTHSSDTALSPSSSPPTELRGLSKRIRPHFAAAAAVRKRPRKPSVQSQTLSVTRISVPVHEDSSSPKSDIQEEEMFRSPAKIAKNEHHVFSSPDRSPESNKDSKIAKGSPPGAVTKLPSVSESEERPRSLRVSLSLPDEVEPGSPLEKVVRNQKLLSPKSVVCLPLWDEDPKTPLELPSSTAKTPQALVRRSLSPSQSSQNDKLGWQRQSISSPLTNRSPTLKSESLLTPFTASALPLQANAGKASEVTDRKRKSPEGGDTAEITSPPLKRVRLNPTSPPASPSEDVFVTSVNAAAKNSVTIPSPTPRVTAVSRPATQIPPSQHLGSLAAKPSPSSTVKPKLPESQPMVLDIQPKSPDNKYHPIHTKPPTAKDRTTELPGSDVVHLTTATPVGYGATNSTTMASIVQVEQQFTSATDTTTVMTVQPLPPDKKGGITASRDSPTPVNNPPLLAPASKPAVSATVKTVSVLQHARPSLLAGITEKQQALSPQHMLPVKQTTTTTPTPPAPPPRKPVMEQPKLSGQPMPSSSLQTCSDSEKLVAAVSTDTALAKPVPTVRSDISSQTNGSVAAAQSQAMSHTPPLPQSKPTIQSPSVIMTSQRHALSTVASPVAHSRSTPVASPVAHSRSTPVASPVAHSRSAPVTLGIGALEPSTTQQSHAVSSGSITTAESSAKSAPTAAKNAKNAPAQIQESPSSQLQAQSLVSSATSSAVSLATVVTNHPLQSTTASVVVVATPSSSTSLAPSSSTSTRRQTNSLKAAADQDIVITSVEKRSQSTSTSVTTKPAHSLPSYSEAVHSRITSNSSQVANTTTAAAPAASPSLPPRGRPQELHTSAKQPSERRPQPSRKITAKIAVSIVLAVNTIKVL